MQNPYLEFYQRQTRKIDKNLIGNLDLNDYPYLLLRESEYVLKPDYLIGRLDHKKTFGFLRQELEDIYIDQSGLSDAMHDDIVIVKEGTQPKIVEIVSRALTKLVATVKTSHRGMYFESETYLDRTLEVKDPGQVVYGHVVMLEIDQIKADCICAHVTKVVGHINDPDIETLKIVAAYDWPQKFSEEVMKGLDEIEIDLDYERKTRKNLSDQIIVTIDGKDAKDLDDAISLEIKDGFYHLGVHIADVSYYVQEGTKIDEEAYKRATSSYLADRVIPMLPHKLSNDLCSLNPHEMKLTLTCQMVLDPDGNVVSHEIFKSYIESYRRLTYDDVNLLLNSHKSLKDTTLDQMLIQMNELSQKLKVLRKKRGEIEFSSSELGFIVDSKGRVLDVYERKTDQAEELIESFMLIANETVAFHLHDLNLPAIYRIHERPDEQKLKYALETISKLGFSVNMKQLGNPKPLQILTENTADSPYGYIVHMALLRAMQKAIYSEKQSPHYGLGARYYTHFTSPIRRYPDLMVHRLIHRLVLNKGTNFKKDYHHFQQMMPEIAQHTSDQERKAIQMERDVAKLKSCEFMADKIGETFKAVITQMMPSGMFVKLQSGIEGFVPLRVMDDYYAYDENNLTFVGNRGKRYRLGDAIKVKLLEVDLQAKKMDYQIVEKKVAMEQKSKSNPKKKNHSKGRKRR